MLNILVLVDFIKGLKTLISEASRSEIAHRMTDLISNLLKDSNPEAYHKWIAEDKLKFLRHCELVNLARYVPDDLYVEPTKLAEFCDRWMSVNLFKLKDDHTSEWRPITPEQNSLRVTMIDELRELALDNTSK
jgi:tRNA A37 N6-isopentenylltransferase MiaA